MSMEATVRFTVARIRSEMGASGFGAQRNEPFVYRPLGRIPGAWSSYHLLTVMAPRTMEREKRVEPKRSVPSSCLARLIFSLTLCAFWMSRASRP